MRFDLVAMCFYLDFVYSEVVFAIECWLRVGFALVDVLVSEQHIVIASYKW